MHKFLTDKLDPSSYFFLSKSPISNQILLVTKPLKSYVIQDH